jgi:hypothetical protein
MYKILVTIITALMWAGAVYAQNDECFIRFKYDESGNRVHRFSNCVLPQDMQMITSTVNGVQAGETTAQVIDAASYSIVYPNPNAGKFWVAFKNVAQNSNPIRRRIYLLNALGQVVLEKESSEQKVFIDAKNIAEGNYFVTIYDGRSNTSHKITILK